jgi:hypothetical protein
VRRFHILAAAGLLLFHCAIGRAQVAGDDVQVTDPLRAGGEVEYEIRSGADCRIRWAVSRTGVNAGIAQLRSDCRLTMGEQLALQSKVLARVAADEPGLRTLFWGGLGKWPEWSGRLALAATRSESWDAKAGQPKVGESINAFVLSLMTFHSGKEFSYGEKDRLVAGDLSDVKGVILFGMRHSDLWDGSKVRYNTDFTDGTKTVSEIHVWETPS